MERMLGNGSGQWAFKVVTARQQYLVVVAVVAAAVATVALTVQWWQW